MANLISVILFFTILTPSFGQQRSETYYKNPDDWRIILANSATGQKWYFNPDFIWKKDTVFTCKIKMTIDTKKKNAFKELLLNKGYITDSLKNNYVKYDYSIYYLITDCDNLNVRVYGLSNLTASGEQLEFIQFPSNKLIPLPKELEESIKSNICYSTKLPFFDRSATSPF